MMNSQLGGKISPWSPAGTGAAPGFYLHPVGGVYPLTFEDTPWLYTASIPPLAGHHVITAIKSILIDVSVVTFEV